MHVGLGLLRLSPRDFWSMTPKEFASAAGLARRGLGTAPARADLLHLMHEFPDRPRSDDAQD
jgi:uncharacterized phage protein (TIGR02216 family)